MGSPSVLSQADEDYAAGLARQNVRAETVDGLAPEPLDQESTVTGFRFGSLTLRPSVDERIVHETNRYGTAKTSRIYSQTTVSGTLQSDWSRHQLSVDGTGTWQKNLSGTGTESPSADINARLNLNLVDDLTALLAAGYSYEQESRTDPNAISGATTQSGIHEWRASAGLQKNLGLLRGTTTVELTRRLYGDATLADGSSVLVDDRDTLGAELTARIGYAISPALIPFLEASIGREKYDQRIDSSGAERSSTTIGGRAGAEVNLGEKLSGELAAGYVLRTLDDANLADISGLTLDGELNWSPLRGTDVNLGLSTTLESATASGQSGAIVYEFDTTLRQQIHSAVVARLGATASYRDYDSGSSRANQRSYGASTGLTWSINRYLDLEADASYERTEEPGATDEETTRIGLGLRMRR
ncbi:outer membrane beta-barrel protein [Hoeflea sp. YIM 152468]|uniref:outer membrane beta-barrel protein n=1 Tax=Hoeflea sp. YIM 152468 TaxID=3031759 RepID=UPI0023DAF548|nr:outer membrane beta-barrel protein [Hoeflea sp. YIM 152468]MDF1607889.1 outer membrane beta-barrel protein [Hoeflea sp. YIM 152468]